MLSDIEFDIKTKYQKTQHCNQHPMVTKTSSYIN